MWTEHHAPPPSVVLINECPLNARLETGVGLSFSCITHPCLHPVCVQGGTGVYSEDSGLAAAGAGLQARPSTEEAAEGAEEGVEVAGTAEEDADPEAEGKAPRASTG